METNNPNTNQAGDNKGTGSDVNLTSLQQQGEGSALPMDFVFEDKQQANSNAGASQNQNQNSNDDAAQKAAKEAADKKAADDAVAAKAKADADAAANEGKDKEPVGIEIDGVQLKLNDKGEAVNAEGKVVKTKEEVDAILADNQSNELPPLTVEVLQNLGLEVLGEDGKPKVYEESTTGLVNLVKDAAEEINKKDRKEFFEAYPIVKDIIDHINNGGKEEDFFKAKTESWKSVSLKDASEAVKLDVIVKDFIARGIDEKTAVDTANLYKDSNRLEVMAEQALKSRQDAEVKDEQAKRNAIAEANKQEEARILNHWKEVEKVITSGKLSEITIPETEKKDFNAYISKAVNEEGYSQASLDRAKMPLDQKILLDYLVFKKFDFSKLIKNVAVTNQAASLRDRLRQNENANNLNRGGNQQQMNEGLKKPNEVDVSIDNIQL